MAGYKDFAHLEVLQADDIDSYLMSQSVPRFASTSARNAAIPSPAAGMLCYVTGQGHLKYTGTAWEALVPTNGMLDYTWACADADAEAVYAALDITGLTIKRTDTYEVKTWTGSAWRIVAGLQSVANQSSTQLTQAVNAAFATNANSLSVSVVVPSSGKLAVSFGGRPYAGATTSFSFYGGCALSGANTVAASSNAAWRFYASAAGYLMPQSDCIAYYSGLNYGATTVTLQYYVTSGTLTMYTQYVHAQGME